MNEALTQQQKEEFRKAVLSNQSSLTVEIAKLVSQGMDPVIAKGLLGQELLAMRTEVVQKTVKQHELGERRYLLFIAAIFITMLGPLLRIESILWYVVGGVLLCICGYYAYSDKPVAGILAAIALAIAIPIAFNYYLEGRTGFIRIELLVPLALGFLPAALTFIIVDKLMYSNSDQN